MTLTRLPRSCKRRNDLSLKVNTSMHTEIKGKSSMHRNNNKHQLKPQHTFEESFTESQIFNNTSQRISATSGLSVNLRSRRSTLLEENSNNLKDKEMTLPRLPRTCKRQNDLSLNVNTSIHSEIKEKSSTHKKKNQLQQKSQHTFEEPYTKNQILQETPQKISATSTPIRPCYVKLLYIDQENTLDEISERRKRGRKKKDPINQVVLFESENENTQSSSKLSINLRSRRSTPLEENSRYLEDKRILRRQPRSCRQSVNHSTNSVSSKMGRNPLICKKNIMKQDKPEENLEESFSQIDDLTKTSQDIPVTSTPLGPYQRKTKKSKNLNICKQSLPKSISTKSKVQTIGDFSLEILNNSAESSICDLRQSGRFSASLKKTCNKAQVKNANHTQKSSTKGKTGKQRILKRHTFSDEFPIDDLSLSKTVQNTRKVKSDGFKVPSKNTLKRKRYVYNEFHKANEGYEDDIYESQEFECFKEILQDTTFSDVSSSMPTPKFGCCSVTPRIFPKTPLFKDCISPTDYAITRKVAEECLYRNKKKKNTSHEETADVPEKKKLEFNEVLENIQMQEKVIEKLIEESRSDKENSYLSD